MSDLRSRTHNGVADGLRARIADLVGQYAAVSRQPQPFLPGITPVPLADRTHDAAELKLMVAAALDGRLSAGRFNEALERKLAEWLGVPRALPVCSGSAANLVALGALASPRLGERALRPGDEVLTVAAASPATVNPILHVGAVPVFIDVDPATLNVDAARLAQAVGPRTRAVVLPHALGNPFDLDAVTDLCRQHDLWLVEDCCDALGSTYRGRMVGTFGDIATLAFHPTQQLATGEGGAVFSRDPELMRIAASLRDGGRDCWCGPGEDNACGKRYGWQLGALPPGFDHQAIYTHLGYDLRLSDLQAACAVARLEKASRFVQARRDNFEFLRRRLRPCEGLLQLPQPTAEADPSWAAFALNLPPGGPHERAQLVAHLERLHIGVGLPYAGNLTRQPSMQGLAWRTAGELAGTDRVARDTFCVGVHPALTEPMLEFVARSIKAFLGVASV